VCAVCRYISRPLLLEGKKFDLRVYMLVANTAPFVVLYRKGYVRLCIGEYRTDSDVMTAHLTNQVLRRMKLKQNKTKTKSRRFSRPYLSNGRAIGMVVVHRPSVCL